MVKAIWADSSEIDKIKNEIEERDTKIERLFENEKGSRYVLAYEQEKAVGIAKAVFGDGEVCIREVWVKSEYRNKGYGDLLLRMIIRKACQDEKLLYLSCPEKRKYFYERLGFQEEKRDSYSYGNCIMVCRQDVKGICEK